MQIHFFKNSVGSHLCPSNEKMTKIDFSDDAFGLIMSLGTSQIAVAPQFQLHSKPTLFDHIESELFVQLFCWQMQTELNFLGFSSE